MGLFFGIAHAAGKAAEHGGGHGEHGETLHDAVVEHGAAGLPQLMTETWGSQIPWLIITLAVLFYILNKIALPRIGGVIEERHDAIEDDLDRAAEFKRLAQEAEANYEQALADARAQAQAIAAKTREEIQAQVAVETAKADAKIAERAAESETRITEIRASALASIETVAADVAEAMLTAIAPETADAEAVKAGVAARLGN